MELTEEELEQKINDAVKAKTEGLFTQDQVNAAISNRLKEEKQKFEKELADREKKASMDASQLEKYEREKLESENKELKSKIQQKEHAETISKLMADKKIDAGFFDTFSGISDIEQAKIQMDKFNETLSQKVSAEIDGKIKAHVPSAPPNNATDDNMTMNAAIRSAAGIR